MHFQYQLATLKKNNASITEYYHKAKLLADTLVAAGKPLAISEFTTFLLAGLGPEYDSLVASFTTRLDPLFLRRFMASFSHMKLGSLTNRISHLPFLIYLPIYPPSSLYRTLAHFLLHNRVVVTVATVAVVTVEAIAVVLVVVIMTSLTFAQSARSALSPTTLLWSATIPLIKHFRPFLHPQFLHTTRLFHISPLIPFGILILLLFTI